MLLSIICIHHYANGHLAHQEQNFINHLKISIKNAYNGKAQCSEDVLAIEGWTSNKVRRLLNNLCSFPDTSYLEISIRQGATFIAALNNNQNTIRQAIGIDNWEKFGGSFEAFKQNCKRNLPDGNYALHEGDSFQLNLQETFNEPVTVYFYDGDHSEQSLALAFTYFNAVFAPVFIAVVDDWNWECVQNGILPTFKKLGYTILYEQILPAHYNGDTDLWWNGVYVAVIRK